MIVIVILGMLAALISGNFFTSLEKGRDARRKGDLEQVKRALEMYYEDKREYPLASEFSALTPLKDPDSTKIYMQKIPADPKSGASYGYEVDVDRAYFRLYACLENDLQILPYTAADLEKTIDFGCITQCKDQTDADADCIWATSSTNTNP